MQYVLKSLVSPTAARAKLALLEMALHAPFIFQKQSIPASQTPATRIVFAGRVQGETLTLVKPRRAMSLLRIALTILLIILPLVEGA